MKRLLHASVFVVLVTASVAPNTNAADAVNLATVRAAVEKARNLAIEGKLTDAEQALVALNRASSNTDDWYMETALRLMQTAEQLARAGKPANVAALANRALQILAQADATAKNAGARAAAKTLAGSIYERYLANNAAALASYESAALLAPDKAGKAKEASDRLKRTDANAKEKVANGGN